MELFRIDSDRNCSIISYVSIVFSRENGIIPIGIPFREGMEFREVP